MDTDDNERREEGMSATPAEVERTTALAIQERSKLIKSLRRFDMVFFTVCAFVGLDTLGTVAKNGPEGFLWLVVIALDQMRPTSSALGGFQTPLNEFAYVTLVFEDVERLRWVERCPVRIEASTI